METIKKIRNDALVQAYQTMHENNTRETQSAVTAQMVRATFLLPVIPVAGKLPEDFPPKVLKNEKGQAFLPVFTDMDQLKNAVPGLSESLIPVDISDVYAYLVEHEELQGVLVNAFAQPNLICPRPMVENLAKLWSRIKTAELNGGNPAQKQQQVKLMVPKEFPDGAAFTLAAGLRGQEDVAKAWMCRIQKAPDQTVETMDWMIIVDAEKTLKGREEIFREIGKSLAPVLGKHNVIFAEKAANLAALTDHATPVYVRDAAEV